MRKLLPVVSVLWALSCSSPPTPCASSAECTGINKCINGTCQDPTGCVAETSPAFCSRLQKNCGTVSGEDNCGAMRIEACGSCQSPQSCVDGTCRQCVAETDVALCARLGLTCNSTSATDNCGALRTINCGACEASKSCGGGGTPNVCGGCVPETEAEFCTAQGKNCGAVTGMDRCGNARTAVCGTCMAGKTCGGGGMMNVCGCTPENDMAFCTRVGKNCGSVTAADNCGAMRTASCGTCPGGAMCGSGGAPANICPGCMPETTPQFCARQGKNCGPVTADDNCGIQRNVVCGQCTGPGETCGGAGTQGSCGCTPESDTAFCGRLQATCGTHTAADNCGAMRTRLCGACSAPQTCGGGSTANACGCMPESTSAFCTRLGRNCDLVTAIDACGVMRTENCGTCMAPRTCGGGGTANVCGCPMETDAQLCTRLNATCGTPALTDLCGTQRTPTCGPSCGTAGGGGGTGGGSGTAGGSGGTAGGSGAGGGSGSGGGSGGCPTAQTFTGSFQYLNSTSTGSFPDWEYRCTGMIHTGGKGCGDFEAPAVELRYQGSQLYKLADSPLTGPWARTPDAGFKPSLSGGQLFCEALGYTATSTQVFANTYPPQGSWAVIQVSPLLWGRTADGGGFSYMEPVLSIDCSCPP